MELKVTQKTRNGIQVNDRLVASNSIISHFVGFCWRFPAVRLRNCSRKIVREAALSACFLYVQLK